MHSGFLFLSACPMYTGSMIAKYFVDFIVFSFMGWIYECIYCTCKTHHWQNRGFLFGPVCPIYGSGAVLGMIVFGILPHFAGTFVPAWKIFLISAAGSAVLEFVTSWVLEKLFHAVWWDYSGVPLNIQGRICLPATIGFGIAGVFIVRFLIPFVEKIQGGISGTASEIASLLLMAVFAADLALTVASLTQLLARIESAQKEFNERMESGYRIAQQGPVAAGAYAATAMLTAAEHVGRKAIGQINGAKKDAVKLLTEASGRLTNKDLHHLQSISRFKEYAGKAPVLRLRERLVHIAGLHQEPLFRTDEHSDAETDPDQKEA